MEKGTLTVQAILYQYKHNNSLQNKLLGSYTLHAQAEVRKMRGPAHKVNEPNGH